ncbi:ABC transporter ATP-binding protein [Halomicrobium salinisoli]|uniref:ABC transporter ATP-binding protein n=1 Tax=Halomicrobium salinisoli TaxID=2878391 RepID=UPI001CF049E8|nr:ABC transporter ATP-binding protein [Halomicrobium salinisoli]
MTDSTTDPETAPVDDPLAHLIGTYGRAHTLRFALGGLALALSQIPGRVPALLVGVALDALFLESTPYALPLVPDAWIPTTTEGQVSFTIALLAASFGLEAGLSWLGGRVSGTATYRTLHDVRVDAFDALVGQEMGYFDDRETGDLMSVLNNDVGNLRRFGDGFFRGLRFTVQVIAAFAFMALLHWQLALLMSLVPLVLAAISYWYAVRVEPRYDDVRETIGTVNSRLEDSVDGVATVKAFGREDAERDAVADVSEQYKRDKWSVVRLRLAYNTSTWLLTSLVFIGVFAAGAVVVMGDAPAFVEPLTAGTLVTFLFYGKSFYAPIRQLVLEVLDSYENALASSKRIVAVLERTNALDDAGEGELTIDDGGVEYDGVSFGYGASGSQSGSDAADRGASESAAAEETTVSDVSFSAEPGDLVGVVGPTGAGKSTIVKLLFRFYDPDAGTIRIDGTDTATVSRRSLRDHLGYVSQDPFLFTGTVRENIAYATDAGHEAERSEASERASGSERSERHASRDEVVAAAKRAGAHEFVTDLPDGYDTDVGERGSRLSGGQRQRIAIARALLRDPAVLVLDEATSHVDNETERQIQESVDDLGEGRTTIAIAHRLSTVRDADLILVLDDGRVREAGTHDELVAEDGLYADLWRVQVGDVNAVSEGFLDREEVVR